jgi:hypothetical protein
MPADDTAVSVVTETGQQHLAVSGHYADLATVSWWAAGGLVLLAVYGRGLAMRQPPPTAIHWNLTTVDTPGVGISQERPAEPSTAKEDINVAP